MHEYHLTLLSNRTTRELIIIPCYNFHKIPQDWVQTTVAYPQRTAGGKILKTKDDVARYYVNQTGYNNITDTERARIILTGG